MSSSSVSAALRWRRVGVDGSITLAIYAQPGAKKTGLVGFHGQGTQMRLKIRVAAPAVERRANAALVAFLAASFGVPRRNVTLVRGETGRRKTLHIEAPAARPDREWETLEGS